MLPSLGLGSTLLILASFADADWQFVAAWAGGAAIDTFDFRFCGFTAKSRQGRRSLTGS